MRRAGLTALWLGLWIGATGVLGGCSWLHFGTQDDETYDYRKSKARQEPLEVPPDLSQLPKDDRFSLPTAASAAKPAAAAAPANASAASPAPAATAPAAPPPAAAATVADSTPSAMSTNTGMAILSASQARPSRNEAGTDSTAAAAAASATPPVVPMVPMVPVVAMVAPVDAHARIEHSGNARWLAVDVSPEQAYTTLKEMWAGMGYKIAKDEPLVGIVETDWSETRPEVNEDALRNGLHKAFGAFDSNGERNKFRARIERTANNTSEITITNRGLVEVVTGFYHDSSKWQARAPDPELEAEMLHRLALRFTPTQPLRVAVASGPAAAAELAPAVPPAAVPGENAAPAASRVHRVASGGSMTLQVEDSLDRTWRQVGVALDRGGFTVEERRRDKNVYAVRYLDPDYELAEREKRSWWNRVFNSEAKVPEQQFLIALSTNGAMTGIEVQDKDGRPDNGATAQRILDQLMEQLR